MTFPVRLVRSVSYFLFGAIYLMASAGKLYQPKAFLRSVLDYQIVPGPLVPWVAAALPGIEFLAGALMMAGAFAAFRRRRTRLDDYAEASAWIGAALMVVFMIVLSFAILRGISMDCGCFDVLGAHIPFLASSKADWGTVARDVVMLLPAYPILAWRK